MGCHGYMVNRHCVWCSMGCHGFMVVRHCVWCLMVDSVKWDNVQNESHDFENEKCVLGIASWGRSSPPKVIYPTFTVRHDHLS